MPELDRGGWTLHYLDEGRGEATPLLLLHGLGSSGRDWQDAQIGPFSEGRRVIAPDLRCCGRSGAPAGTEAAPPSDHAVDVVALLDHLGIEQCDVIGYSMGGAVALQLALDAPQRIRRLILANSAASFTPTTLRLKFELNMRLFLIRYLGVPRLAKIIGKRLFPREDQKAIREEIVARYAKNRPESYRSALLGLASWDVEERLGSIDLETLVLTADHDYTPVDEKRRWAAKLPRATVQVIADSRHGTPLDQPEAFNQAVLAFLG